MNSPQLTAAQPGFVKQASGEFTLCGNLDRENVTCLWLQRDSLWLEPAHCVVLSLRDVGLTDTAGLALLVGLNAEARLRDIQLTLCELPPQLQAAAEICQLDRVLEWR